MYIANKEWQNTGKETIYHIKHFHYKYILNNGMNYPFKQIQYNTM